MHMPQKTAAVLHLDFQKKTSMLLFADFINGLKRTGGNAYE